MILSTFQLGVHLNQNNNYCDQSAFKSKKCVFLKDYLIYECIHIENLTFGMT